MNAQTYPQLASCIDLLLDAICVVDTEGRFVFVSAACERIFGYTPAEMIGQPMIDMVAPQDRERTLAAASEIMAGQPKHHFENRYIRKDGQTVHIMWSARWSEDSRIRIAVARDITERKQAESKQAALYAISEAAHATDDLPDLFRHIHQIIGSLLPAPNFSVAMWDEKNGELNFAYHVDERDQPTGQPNQAGRQLCAEVIRLGQPMLLTPERLTKLRADLHAVNNDHLLCWLGVPLKSHKGTVGALVLQSYAGGSRYTDRDKELLQFVSTQIATAIERKQMQARLQYMAQYDELTGLPNRVLLNDRLEMALVRARREQGRMSLLYLDLDKFKDVNDTLGHAAGDLLLQEVAQRLRKCVREADTVARIGGDEFVVLLEYNHAPKHAQMVSDKIRNAIHAAVNIEGNSLTIMPSIGIAMYPDHGDNARQLMRHADEAMYRSKKR